MGERALILPPLRRSAIHARQFATIVHEGQTDKSGQPYIEHLSRVAKGVHYLAKHCPFWNDDEIDEACQIAWLHDTIEDTWVAGPDLDREGFSNAVLHGVLRLSNIGKVRYEIFVQYVVEYGDLPTILVKLADVEDNSDPERLALLPAETRDRLLRKYEPAKEVLRAAARQKGWQG